MLIVTGTADTKSTGTGSCGNAPFVGTLRSVKGSDHLLKITVETLINKTT